MSDSEQASREREEELAELRRRVAELQAVEAEFLRTRETLGKGWESLRLLLEESLDATAVVDRDGVIRYISPSIERMTGYHPDALQGASVFDFVHPDDIEELRADFLRGTMTLAQTHKRQFRYKHADGTWHVMESTGINLLDDPTVAGLVVSARDVTKRINLEKSLKESEGRYRALIESQGVGICEVDPDEEFVFANAEAHRILGVPEGELPGHNLREFMDEENYAIVREQTGLRVQGIKSTYDVVVRRPGGERRTLRVTATPRLDETGKLIASLAVFSDVSEAKEAEEARRNNERYYRSLIRNAGEMISVVDRDLRFRWGSATGGRITGYAPGDIYGHSLLDYVHPDEVEQAREDFARLLLDPGASITAERRFRHKDGSYHIHDALLTNLLEDPAVQGIVMNSRDITERKRIEEELLARNQELDAFARTVAHDLRTPLSLIEGYAQLLQDGSNTPEEEQSFLSNIINAVRHMDKLTESLLEYAQAGYGSGEVSLIDSGEVIGQIISQELKTLKQNHIKVEVQENLPAVTVDEVKFRQAIANLVDNAIKYTQEGKEPRIEIGARPSEREIVFFVRDNGRGIKKELQEEIFLPFKRFAGSAPQGLGIGLSTVKQAVESWGGRIWVESAPGEGSTFLFTIGAEP